MRFVLIAWANILVVRAVREEQVITIKTSQETHRQGRRLKSVEVEKKKIYKSTFKGIISEYTEFLQKRRFWNRQSKTLFITRPIQIHEDGRTNILLI